MATITKSSSAPAELNSFAVANQAFDLSSGSVDTTNQDVIDFAQNSPYFDVTLPEAAKAEQDAPVDPRTLPANDHLSSYASQESIDAAKANEAAIRATVDGTTEQPEGVGDAPSVEQQQKDTFAAIGVDAEPVSPITVTEPVPADTAPAPTTPAAASATAQPAPAEKTSPTTSGDSSTAPSTGASN